MAIYFSPGNCAFYDTAIMQEAQMPADKVAVTDARYAELEAAQASGSVIIAGNNGEPSAVAQTCGTCTCTVHEMQVATTDVLGHVKSGGGFIVGEAGEIGIVKGTIQVAVNSWTLIDGVYFFTFNIGDYTTIEHVQVLKGGTNDVTPCVNISKSGGQATITSIEPFQGTIKLC